MGQFLTLWVIFFAVLTIPHSLSNPGAAGVIYSRYSIRNLFPGASGRAPALGIWEPQVFLCPSHAPGVALASICQPQLLCGAEIRTGRGKRIPLDTDPLGKSPPLLSLGKESQFLLFIALFAATPLLLSWQ